MGGPLAGVKVLDFTEVIAGPLAGRLLAEMGAEVIKIEPPWGDPWRTTQPFMPQESRSFITYNRGKRSLPLDLTKPEAQEVLGRLASETDVVLVNYRPDVAVKLGVDYDTLAQVNPRLIYCEMTAYGRQGPDAHRPGYDMILQAMTGMMAAENKTIDGIPQWVWSSPVIDTTSGMCMAWCVCAALFAREQTGRGQKIETSLLASALFLMGSRLLQVEDRDQEARAEALKEITAGRAAEAPFEELVAISPGSRRLLYHGNVYYRVYDTKDAPIAVGCLSDPLRRRLLDALGLTDVNLESGYDPNTPEAQEYARSLLKRAEAVFRQKTSGEWLALFEQQSIPAGPLRFVEELIEDPQVLANGLLVEVEHQAAGRLKTLGPVAQFSETPFPSASSSPTLGQHTAEILKELGYSDEDILRWRQARVVS